MSDPARTPGLPLAEVRVLLDDALVRLATAGGDAQSRREAALAMAAALADVDAALSDPAMFGKGTASALSRVRSAAEAATSSAESSAAAELARCLQALTAVRWEPRAAQAVRKGAPQPLLRATVGEPALLDFARGPIRPQALVLAPMPEALPALETPEPTPEPPPLTLAELEAALALAQQEPEPGAEEEPPREEAAEPPPAEAPPATDAQAELSYFGAVLTEEQVLFDRAKTCVEDLSLLGSMRRPLPDQGWAGRAEAERRLLARADAIAACGEGVLPGLVTLLEERPVPDPGFTWALVFLFGSIAGDDAAAQAIWLSRIAPLDADGMADAVSDALALAPHPQIGSALGEWLFDPLPERRMAAVRALSRRSALTSQQAVAAAMDGDPRVVLAGATALGTSSGSLDPAALGKLLQSSDDTVVRAALESALIRRKEIAARQAARLVEQGRTDATGAAVILAVSSGPEGFEPLRKAAAAGSTDAALALGWYGHPEAVPDLLDLLQGPAAGAAVEALQLITGASLTDADPDPTYEEGEGPFTASQGPVPLPAILATDPAIWRAWWTKHGKAARPAVRYRFGHPWSLADDLGQIEARLATRRDRWPAYLELCARSGANLPFDPDAFVARQRISIAAWSDFLGQRRSPAGAWPVRLERS